MIVSFFLSSGDELATVFEKKNQQVTDYKFYFLDE